MNPSSRASDRFAVAALFGAALSACAAATPLPDGPERRRPDGVAIDPVSAPPAPRDRAEASDGLVTLRTPLGVDRALHTVEELFRKIVLEDGEGLEALFTRDALAITNPAASGSGQTPQALALWQTRFRKLDYTRLAGDVIYRSADLTIHRGDDALEASPHPAIRVDALAPSDVVIKVPILTPRVGADRLFGDEMILWLRRDGDRYRIFRVLEEFQLS